MTEIVRKKPLFPNAIYVVRGPGRGTGAFRTTVGWPPAKEESLTNALRKVLLLYATVIWHR